MSVVELPTGHVHHETPPTVEREAIVKYLRWAAESRFGSVLSPEERQGVAYAAEWVNNRLDQGLK